MSRISKGFWDLANRLREETEDARSSLKKEEAEEKKNKIKAFVRRSSKKNTAVYFPVDTRPNTRVLANTLATAVGVSPYHPYEFSIICPISNHLFILMFLSIQLYIRFIIAFPVSLTSCLSSPLSARVPPLHGEILQMKPLIYFFLFPFSPPSHSLPSPVRQSLSIYLSPRIRFCHRVT